MELKPMTEEQEELLINTLESEGFEYTLFYYGWKCIKDVLAKEEDIKKVTEAISVLEDLRRSLPEES